MCKQNLNGQQPYFAEKRIVFWCFLSYTRGFESDNDKVDYDCDGLKQ